MRGSARVFRMLLAAAALAAGAARAETLADRLMGDYERVQSVSAEIRRDTASGDFKQRFLSRVFYERPNRLHVQNVTPVKRRIVCDGTNFFSYAEGDRKGFTRPVSALDADMTLSLVKVPGTAMDHLLRLRGVAETNLPPAEDAPVRRGYAASNVFVVLSLDATGRLARVEFFSGADRSLRTARCDYSQFEEVLPKVWIPCLHQTVLTQGGVESRETVRVTNLAVNKTIPPNLFNPALYFRNVTFVGSFDEIYR